MRTTRFDVDRLLVSLVAGLIAVACAEPAAAQVFIRGAGEHGQGLLRARQNECFVVTPEHVVEGAGDEDRIRIVAEGRVERTARFEAAYGSDVALLRVESERPLACPAAWDDGEQLSTLLRSAREGVVVTMSEHGGLQRRFVRIAAFDDRSITVRAIDAGDQLFQGLSGSRLVVAGVPAGMLLDVDTGTGEGIVLRHDHLTDLLKSFFGRAVADAPARPTIDVAAATPILDRAVAAKDMSTQGQVEAIEALLATGFGFSGADLSGIRLTGASLVGGSFGEARLAGTDLARVRAAQADFGRANLTFTSLRRADLTDADLTAARAGFADADSVVLRNAKAARASFYGASLRNADLRGADLSGASFVMADLRGARLDGANLTNALFFMAWLEGASFTGATVSNTEVSGAILPERTLTAAQARGTCTTWDDTHYAGPLFQISIVEQIPSSRFSGGMENSRLEPLNQYGTRQFSTRGLPRCQPGRAGNPGVFAGARGEQLSLEWGGLYETALVSKAGRRSAWMRRIDAHMLMMMQALRAWHRI